MLEDVARRQDETSRTCGECGLRVYADVEAARRREQLAGMMRRLERFAEALEEEVQP